MLTCPQCKRQKPKTAFNLRPNGRKRGPCRKCEAAQCKRWEANLSPERKEALKKTRGDYKAIHRIRDNEARDKWIAENPEEHKRQSTIRVRRHNKKHPKRYAARTWVNVQRRNGLIPLEPCVFCGVKETIHRCHVDYDYPTFTFPACRKHHYDYDAGRTKLPKSVQEEFENHKRLALSKIEQGCMMAADSRRED